MPAGGLGGVCRPGALAAHVGAVVRALRAFFIGPGHPRVLRAHLACCAGAGAAAAPRQRRALAGGSEVSGRARPEAQHFRAPAAWAHHAG
ncbi:protein of unknown function [Cupriavidus taiwanensis]|uniref:Uncharacterized protein n=1 Tax=Cupriavidus taiwanensis TaxID=164546 RepID=A0A7Z7JEC3_9BURK|nr:protein of unknown function [Cupriavidus taiwanensis]SOZ41395.1 protein of unknown function [Cupriavidus taiwanensis]SPC23770.1 protein of unknown function [Cupriavidus taiwanensis]